MRSRTGCHLIVGLDEGRVTLTTASVRRGQFRILGNRHLDLPREPDALVQLVHAEVARTRPRPESIHVIFGGTEVTRFQMNLPALKRAEREIVLQRRARQEANVAVDAPIRIGIQRGGRVDGDQRTWRVAAFPATACERMRGLVEDPFLHVETVSIWEDAALLALPDDLPEHAVVLDRNQRGVRITYLASGSLAHERQVLLPKEDEADRASRVERLRFELARTLDYFAGEGSPPPAGIASTPSLGLTEDEATRIAGDLPLFALDLPQLPETTHGVELAPLGLLRMLAGLAQMPVLDQGRPTRSRGKRTAVLGLATLVVLAALGLREATTYASIQADAAARVAPMRDQLTADAADLRAELTPDTEETPDEKRLKSVLGMRRPASRMLADVLSRIPAGVVLRDISYDESERITIRGEAVADDRLANVRAVAALRSKLSDLPYLSGIEDHLSYPTQGGDAERVFRFVIHAQWQVAP